MVDQQKLKDIKDVLNYRKGNYFVGGIASCRVCGILDIPYGAGKLIEALNSACGCKIDEVYDYLKDYIKHMKSHPSCICPICNDQH